MTQLEIERQERLIAAINRLSDQLDGLIELTAALELSETLDALTKIAAALEKPSPGWRRMLDEFRQAAMRIPTTIRARF